MHYWFLFKVAVNCLNDILLLVRITALRGTWRIFGISILVIGLRVEVRWTQTTTLGWDLFFLGAILKFCMLLVCLLLATSSVAYGQDTYGRLALAMTQEKWVNMMNLVPSLTHTSSPSSVSPLRKSILSTRNMLDIFAFAFPLTTGHPDMWALIWEQITYGYVAIGRYHDLRLGGDPQEQLVQLQICLNWKESFLKNDTHNDYFGYLLTATDQQMFLHHSLSEFFWGGVSVRPSSNLTGLQNVITLEKALLKEAEHSYSDFIAVTKPESEDTEDIIHDFRKLVRGIVMISNDFKIFTDACATTTEALSNIDEVYDRIGKVHDLYVIYQDYSTKGQSAKMKKALANLNLGWKHLVAWMKGDGDTKKSLKCLVEALP